MLKLAGKKQKTSTRCEKTSFLDHVYLCCSNKGTGGMECSVVPFKPRIRLFACTLPSVSNSLDCNDWLACKHVCVRGSVYSPLTKHVWIVVLVVYKHRLHSVFQTRLDYGSVAGYKHLPSASLIKHVWNLVPVVYKHQSPPVFQTHLG